MVMIEIYMNCGMHEEAMDKIDELLSLETTFTAESFKLRPLFDPLRDLPRFREIMARYALPGNA